MFTEQKSSDVFARTQRTSCQWSDKRSDGLSGKQSLVFSPPPTCSESKTTACRSMTSPQSWRPLFVCQRGGRRRERLGELQEKIHQFAFRTDRDSGEFRKLHVLKARASASFKTSNQEQFVKSKSWKAFEDYVSFKAFCQCHIVS